MKKLEKEISGKKVYFHIDNGGISISVDENINDKCKGYPLIKISSSHFGHLTHLSEILTNPETLKLLGNSFIEKANEFEKIKKDEFDKYYILKGEIK